MVEIEGPYDKGVLLRQLEDSQRQTREALKSYEAARQAVVDLRDKLARVEKIWEAWADDPDPMVQALLRHLKGALDG